jgi:feruloyl esterase
MTGPRRLGQLAAILFHCLNTVSAAGTCSKEAFQFPDLFGAQWLNLNATELDNFKLNATTPEGALIPTDGISVCNVTVQYVHPGQNDTTNVQVWLPLKNWNGRFAGVGGGGFTAGNFNGETLAATVNLGFSAAVTDSGHTTATWNHAPWILTSPGNLNYPKLVNFATLSIHEMTVIGKSITAQYYGTAPKFSYFNGCSTGGRQGVTSAQKYPNDYDGILAGAPALNLPDLTISTYWPQSVMDRLGIYPPKCEFDAINKMAVDYCDALDGVTDGFIADPDACDFDPQTVVGRSITCGNDTLIITSEAAAIVKAIRTGPTGADGKPIWVGTAHGTPFTGTLALANTNCTGGPCRGVPFPMAVDWLQLFVRKDPKYNVTAMTIQELEQNYIQSRQELTGFIGANDPDLSMFKSLKKKMITWHGLADECITMRCSRLYYDTVVTRDTNAKDYYRHFEGPGVNHCNGVPGAFYPLHALTALMRWVEGGVAPEVLTGYKLPNATVITQDPTTTRPICMYPNVLTYNGGDSSQYGSFSCEPRTGKALAAARSRDEL